MRRVRVVARPLRAHFDRMFRCASQSNARTIARTSRVMNLWRSCAKSAIERVYDWNCDHCSSSAFPR